MASGDKDSSSNTEMWGNLSKSEILKYFKRYIADKYQRAKNTTSSSPVQQKFGQKFENETTSQTNTPEPPSKSPIQARLELLMGNPNVPPDIKSALKFLLEGNTTQSALSTTPMPVPQSTDYDESSGNESGVPAIKYYTMQNTGLHGGWMVIIHCYLLLLVLAIQTSKRTLY